MEALSNVYEVLSSYYKENKIRFGLLLVFMFLAVMSAISGFKGNASFLSAGLGWVCAGLMFFSNEISMATKHSYIKEAGVLMDCLAEENKELKKELER